MLLSVENGAVTGTPPQQARLSTRPRSEMLWLLAMPLLAFHAAIAWLSRDPEVLTGGDDAVYLLLARALRHFSYREVFDASHPIHHFYPPGYPAILAIWGGFVGERFDALVLLSIGASVATLALVFWALRERFSPLVALLSLMALATNPALITAAGKVLSEPVYALVSLLPLVLLVRPDPGGKRLLQVAVLAIFAALTRSIGVTLVIALGLHWLIERRFGTVAAFASASAALIGAWFGWVAIASRQAGTGSYFDQAVNAPTAGSTGFTVVSRVLRNVPGYLSDELPWFLSMPAVPGSWIDNVLTTTMVAVGFALGVVALFRRWRPAALYLLAYAVLLLVWPWRVGRFLLPIIPLLVPATILGLGVALRPLGARWRVAGMVALTLVIAATGSARAGESLRERQGCTRGSRPPSTGCLHGQQAQDQGSFFAALDYIDRRLPRDAVFLVAKRAPLYYYTERLSVPFDVAIGTAPREFVPHLRRSGVTHVLLSNLARRERGLLERLAASCGELVLERAFPPRTYLFRIRDGGTPDTSSSACEALAEYRKTVVGHDRGGCGRRG